MSVTRSAIGARDHAEDTGTAGVGVKIFAAYVFSVPLGSYAVAPVSLPLIPSTLSSALGALVIIAMLVEIVTSPGRRERLSTSARVWLALLGYVALTYAWSINRPETETGVTALASLVGMSVLVSAHRFTRREIRILEASLVASGAFTGAIAVYQWWFDALPETRAAVNRFALVGGDPNHTAAALLLPAGAALMMALDPTERRGRRALAAVAFGLAGGAVLLTASRGGLIALASLLVVILVRSMGLRRSLAVLLPALVLMIALPLPSDQRPVGATGRDSVWRIGAVSCDDGCWVGGGLGTFPDLHEATALARPELANLELRYEAHNLWLGAVVELGVLGLVLVLMIIGLAFESCLRSVDRLGGAAFAGLLSVLVANLFIMSLEFKYFWTVVLVATITAQTAQTSSAPRTIGASR
jgi:O-antigen ligase